MFSGSIIFELFVARLDFRFHDLLLSLN